MKQQQLNHPKTLKPLGPSAALEKDRARSAKIAANRAKAALAEAQAKKRKIVKGRVAQAEREQKLHRGRDYKDAGHLRKLNTTHGPQYNFH